MKNLQREKISTFVLGVYKGVISGIFFLILAALLFMAACSTSFIDKYEKIYFLPDNPWLNLLAVLAVMVVLTLIHVIHRRRVSMGRTSIIELLETDDVLFKKVRSVFLLLCGFVIGLWVICTQVPATVDQRAVLLAAEAIAQRDFSPQSQVTYFYVYNNQIGIVMLVFLLNRIFGEFNLLAYQLLNVVCIIFIIKNMSEIGGIFGVKRSGQLAIIILCAVFLPLPLYSSFIYGTIPGLLFALLGIKYELIYFQCEKCKNALISSLCIGFAVLLKMNYLIFMVGMLIYAAVEVILSRRTKQLLYVLVVILFFLAQAKIPTMTYEKISGEQIPQGASKWAWAVMGLQNSERPGWYNGYARYTLEASDFDVQKQEAWVKADLKTRLEELWEDNEAARDFFVRKTASQWNEPSFQSVWISITHYQDGYKQDVISVDNDWPRVLLSRQGNHTLTQYLNYLNFLILAGAMLYIVLGYRDEHFHASLIFAMIFIGGFLFHLVWEAKGQYTLPYFVLLLPYTVMGYSAAADRLASLRKKALDGAAVLCVSKKELIVKLVLLAVAILILWYVFHGTMGSLTGDSEAYMSYLAHFD